MTLKRYMRDRVRELMPNPNCTAGYPYTAKGNPAVVENPSITPLSSITVYGNSVQNGTPTPEVPIEVVSVENPAIVIKNGEDDANPQSVTIPYTLLSTLDKTVSDEIIVDTKNQTVKLIRRLASKTIPTTQTFTEWLSSGNRCQLYSSLKKKSTETTLGSFPIGELIQNFADIPSVQLKGTGKIGAVPSSTTIYWYPKYSLFGITESNTKAEADAALQTWLATLTDEQRTIWYVLATPTETDITNTEAGQALLALILTPHTTNIFSLDAEAQGDLSVKYHSFDYREENSNV